MIFNNIKIALRNLYHSKFFSLINILGLSLGLTCSLLILTVVRQELSFDHFHEDRDHIFVMQTKMELGTGSYTTDRCGAAVGPSLAESFPVISSFVRHSEPSEMLLTWYPEDTIQASNSERKNFIEQGVVAVDSNFLTFFSFPAIMGDITHSLDDPYSIVLTREMAEKYFGDENPLNQFIRINGKYDVQVTAVLEDPPLNSTIRFDFLINFRLLDVLGEYNENFDGNPYFTFFYLDVPEAVAGLDTAVSRHLDEYQSESVQADQKFISLNQYHKKGETKGQLVVMILSLLAAIILLIACINFMNLSTARYLNRTREVGIRKVVGASRSQLIRQFIGETMIITFLAINLSILALDFALPEFNRLFELEVKFELKDPVIIAGLIGIFLVTSLVSGSYPAFFLSSFNAVSVLQKVSRKTRKGMGIRKTLVILQFVFTTLFIITTIVNFKQVKLLNESMEDVDSQNIIYFPVRGELFDNYSLFKQEVQMHPGVESVTTSAYVPKYVDRGEFEWGLTEEMSNDLAMVCPAGYDFPNTFNLELDEGRFYSMDNPSDSISSIVINRAVADALELEDPIGRTFHFLGDQYTIIGIMKNYNFSPLSLAGDKALFPFREVGGLSFIRTTGGDRTAVRDHIESVHEKYNPDFPFDHYYLDEYEDPISNAVGILIKIILVFTSFGIFISYLGLFGLSVYSTEQRTKEIGIRKVAGASSMRVLRLVVYDFTKLILISLLISLPISILLMRVLLQAFAEKVQMGPGLFLITSFIIITIAILTVSYQSLKLSRSNPAKSLQYE